MAGLGEGEGDELEGWHILEGWKGLTYMHCAKQVASGNLLHSIGSSAWCTVMT